MNSARRLIENSKRYYESITKACDRIVDEHELEITGKYLYQMAYYPHKYKASDKLWRRIREALNGKREYPPTLPVRFESEADKNLVRDRLTNDERAKVLREAAERKERWVEK